MLEIKYISLLSSRLRNYKRKSGNMINFSCPICGDSQIKKNRARGYIYNKNQSLLYHCHNCNVTMSASKFIKYMDEALYKDYVIEKLKSNKTPEQEEYESFINKMKKPKYMTSNVLKGLRKVSQLSPEHVVKKFVESRKIPNIYHSKLFACPNFMHYVNSIIPNKFSENALNHDETRLLIPFIDSSNNVHAFQGRSIGKSDVKYITIVVDESIPKLYGLDTVNFNKSVPVLEGPIDSMFVPNSISTAGGDLSSTLNNINKDNLVIVYDNEPRSSDTVRKIDKAIMLGYNVCIWPDNLEHKDVNDMILAGLSSDFISYIIKENTYKDLAAKLRLTKWKKT